MSNGVQLRSYGWRRRGRLALLGLLVAIGAPFLARLALIPAASGGIVQDNPRGDGSTSPPTRPGKPPLTTTTRDVTPILASEPAVRSRCGSCRALAESINRKVAYYNELVRSGGPADVVDSIRLAIKEQKAALRQCEQRCLIKRSMGPSIAPGIDTTPRLPPIGGPKPPGPPGSGAPR